MRLRDLAEIVDEHGRYHVPDPAMVALGDTILRVFCDMRPAYTPGVVRVGKKDLIHFYKAALLCHKLGLTPERFVREQLEGMAMVGLFWPSAIACPTFRDHKGEESEIRALAMWSYKSMLQIFVERCRIYGPRDVLGDETAQLSPLFRAVMALQYGLADIAAQQQDAARLELAASPVAKELFRELAEPFL